MHGYFGCKNPRFEDFDYTSWLPDDDSFAWLGNGNTVAEFTDVGDSTLYHVDSALYLDYADVSKVLPVPTRDYPNPPQAWELTVVNGDINGYTNGDLSAKQNAALENKLKSGTTSISNPNPAIDLNGPAETKIAASGETMPLGPPVVLGN